MEQHTDYSEFNFLDLWVIANIAEKDLEDELNEIEEILDNIH
jgi:hypothetical protein